MGYFEKGMGFHWIKSNLGCNVVIRVFNENDLYAVMQIWFDTNIITHNFISKSYWIDHYDMVKEILPQAEEIGRAHV